MTSYWDLYIAYVRECEKLNRANDIDPHHYEMEWNHTLPQCLFGDLPFGQFLTLRQHAIASCLQTLAFQKVCFGGFHQKFVPEWLWEECVETCKQELAERAQKGYDANPNLPRLGGCAARDQGVGIFSLTAEERRERSRHSGSVARDKKAGIHGATPEQREEWSKRALEVAREMQVGIYALSGEKRKEIGAKSGRKNFENRVGIHALTPDQKRMAGEKGRRVKFRCLITGYVSNGAGLSSYQRARGIDTTLRVRVE